MTSKSVTYAVLGGALVALLWGVLPLIQKDVLDAIHPSTVIILNTLFLFGALAAFAMWQKQVILKDVRHMSGHVWFKLLLSGAVLSASSTVLYSYMLKHCDTSILVPVVYSAPVFTVLLSAVVFGETITLAIGLGLALTVAGLVVMAVGVSTRNKTVA
jgi:uncharacterized membrane protein